MNAVSSSEVKHRSASKSCLTDILFSAMDAGEEGARDMLPDLLQAIRSHLGMQVAFIARFTEGRREFRYVDSDPDNSPIAVGMSDPLEESYCQRVVDGRLPELITDASENAEALRLSVTKSLPVRAHLSVPIRLSNGEIYGTFCCFNMSSMDSSLDERDLAMMKAFADFSARQVEQRREAEIRRKASAMRIKAVLEAEAYTIHYQPIYDVENEAVIGFESLTRFQAQPVRTPDVWFKEAYEAGLSEELEMAVIEKALDALEHFPEHIFLTLNVSPSNILNGAVTRTLADAQLERIVLEITEHHVIANYSEMTAALEPLRARGLTLAVDDAGAGHSSFRHIIQLRPEIIKLDMDLTRDIDTDMNRRALAAAMISFAGQTGSHVVAEGVETESEMTTLRSLRVARAQGYFLGRPADLESACRLLASETA